MAVGVWVCLLAPGLWAAERTTASFVPADAFLVFYYDGGHPGFKETTLARFFQEPEVRDTLAQLRPVAEAIDKNAMAKDGIEATPLIREISGTECLVALLKPAAPGGKPGLLFSMNVGEGDMAARRVAERLIQAGLAKAQPGSAKESTVGNLTVRSYVNNAGNPNHTVFVGASLVAANDLSVLKRALDPGGPKFVLPGGEDRAVVGARYDHAAMRAALGAQIDPNVAKLLDALGLGALGTASVNVIPRGQRLLTRLDVEVAGGEKLAGLMKWFADCPSFDPELLKRVPQAPTVCWVTSADIPGLWDAAWAVAGTLDARAAEEARKGLAEHEGKAGLKLREGLLGPLGRGTVLIAKQDGPNFYTVALQRVRDAKALEQGLAQVGSRLDLALGGRLGPFRCGLKPFVYRGHTCHYLWLMGNVALGLPGIVPCYTNLGDVFVFATNPLDLKGYLDFVEDQAPTILDDPEFKALQTVVPASATSLFYGKWTDQAVATYNTVAPWLAAAQGAAAQDLLKAIDLANLPSSRLIRRYSGPAIGYSIFQNGRYRMEVQGKGLELLSPQMATVGTTAVLAGMLLPALTRARAEARLIRDRNNLNMLAKGFATYLNEFGDNRRYPKGLGELFDKGILPDKAVFVSPLDEDPPKLANGLPCSYVSCFDKYPTRQFLDDFPPNMIMAWDRKPFLPQKRSVLFFDSHVEVMDEPRFERLLGELDNLVKRQVRERQPVKQGPAREEPVKQEF
jgi:hypothetical protein